MTFWAVLPYAVSLATSVGYQSLRNSDIPNTRKRAYDIFHRSCDILDRLSRNFLSARMMARLAKNTLQEVERVSVSKPKNQGLVRSRDEVQSADADFASGQEVQTVPSTEGVSNLPSYSPHLRLGGISAMQMNDIDDMYSVTDEASVAFNGIAFTNIGEIFDAFDGSFDLGRVDALFSTNLNPTMPLMPKEWIDLQSAEYQ
ncbi:hypothetical protein TPAR_04866 [Tolypocladium paradoxum]|uniref:Fungal specific transcription factor n=1 Tax=Tolypocladium paradoxum TaxID=94208 RepID=A0A2S4KXP7_9HYPO|nr:hypothetical protein TPAR_04866 [Tolypocladium paradoxum]